MLAPLSCGVFVFAFAIALPAFADGPMERLRPALGATIVSSFRRTARHLLAQQR
jgi:hypothetical protein